MLDFVTEEDGEEPAGGARRGRALWRWPGNVWRQVLQAPVGLISRSVFRRVGPGSRRVGGRGAARARLRARARELLLFIEERMN